MIDAIAGKRSLAPTKKAIIFPTTTVLLHPNHAQTFEGREVAVLFAFSNWSMPHFFFAKVYHHPLIIINYIPHQKKCIRIYVRLCEMEWPHKKEDIWINILFTGNNLSGMVGYQHFICYWQFIVAPQSWFCSCVCFLFKKNLYQPTRQVSSSNRSTHAADTVVYSIFAYVDRQPT